MAITRERFEQGMTLEQYQAQMTQNQEAFAANIAGATLRPEDVAFFAGLSEPINTLIITEDWCGDALANAPVLAKVAAETGKLNLRFFLRDQNLDLADQYLRDGKYRSVPVFVFFDQEMNELGHFIERPARATAEMHEGGVQLIAAHPERPDLAGGIGFDQKGFEQMSEESRKIYFGMLRQLREERGVAWREMLLDDIEALLGAKVAAR